MKRMLALLVMFLGLGALLSAEVNDLIAQLKSSDSDARRVAAKKLSEAGREAKSAAPALVQALHDKDRYVRRFAAEALGKIDADPRTVVPALALALRDGTKEVQQAAAGSLGSLGPNAVPALAAILKDREKDATVRGKAAEALGKIGPAAKSAIPTLTEILQGSTMGKAAAKKKAAPPTADIRLEVVTALGEIATANDKAALAALENARTTARRDQAMRQAANKAVQQVKERK